MTELLMLPDHSKMSPNVHKIRQTERLEYIEKNILFKTQEEIAKDLQVTKKTIYRDIAKWKSKGGFEQFLETEFFELYGIEKRENPSRALDRIIYLMSKQVVNQTNININVSNQINELIKISREAECKPQSNATPSATT